jgi:two-component system, NarL family, sensor kinase
MSCLLRSILLISCIILCTPSFTQERDPDARVIIADSLFEAGQYENAISKYQEYIEAMGKNRDSQIETVADCSTSIGFCYYKLDRYNEAITWFLKAAALQNEMGDRESYANSMNNIGLNYKILGEFDKAIDYYERAVKIDEELGNKTGIAKTYNNIGMIYRAWGKYDKAIEFFDKSYRLRQSLNDQPGMSKTLNNMGLVYTEWKKYDQAILLFRESLQLEEALNNEGEAAISLNNLGRVYYYMKQYDTALSYFEKNLKVQLRIHDQDQAALSYNNIGKVYMARNQYQDAAIYFGSALAIFSELGMESEKSTVLANLSRISKAMGNFDVARQQLDSSTVIADKLNLRNQAQQNYLYYSDLYSELKDFERSLTYYKKYTAEKDSVFTKEILSQLSEFQVKYEKEKDQAHILALEKENLQKTNQRNAYMFTGLGIIVIALFIIVYFRQRARHVKMIAEHKILQLEEEKKLMAAKLIVEGQEEERKRIATELHDGLGVLLSATKMQFSVIRDKSPENKELIEKATRMLEQASGDVRKISHNMMPGLLTKLGFYEAIQDLFEHVDDTHELKAVCTISGNTERIAENKEIMLYRIVQEMVNNTLKHAHARNIELQVMVKQGMMELLYLDDGKGFDIRQDPGSESIGLKSIRSRVDFLNGKVEIFTEPGKGVKYTLQIPT